MCSKWYCVMSAMQNSCTHASPCMERLLYSQLILCQNKQCRIACLTQSIEFTRPKCRDSYAVCIAWHCDDSEVQSKRQTFYSFHLVRFLYISVHYLSTCNCCTAYALVGQLRSLYKINLFFSMALM